MTTFAADDVSFSSNDALEEHLRSATLALSLSKGSERLAWILQPGRQISFRYRAHITHRRFAKSMPEPCVSSKRMLSGGACTCVI